ARCGRSREPACARSMFKWPTLKWPTPKRPTLKGREARDRAVAVPGSDPAPVAPLDLPADRLRAAPLGRSGRLDVAGGDARLERRDARPRGRFLDQDHAYRRAGRGPRLRLRR